MTLPNFIIIGAAKAGTTALYWHLAEHPEIKMSTLKETNFFAYGLDEKGDLLYGNPELHRFPIRTLPDYEAQFEGRKAATAIGEASPIYLECPQAAPRIRELLPEARIICGLREPIDRAYSDYLMYLRNRGVTFDPNRDLSPDAKWAKPESHWVRIGKYHDMLARYYALFPREQIHVFLFDDVKTDMASVVGDIYRFLGVDASYRPDLETPHNVGGVPDNPTLERFLTNRGLRTIVDPLVPRRLADWARRLRTSNLRRPDDIPDELRARLKPLFRDDIAATEKLIGRDLRAWQ